MQPDPSPARETCCAVVVTYHPDDRFPERVARIAAQVPRVWVVDNGSSAAAREMLAGVASRDPRVELVLVDSNEGIAAAFNRGLARAVAEGFGWAITLDQDSVVEPDLVAELAAVWAEHPTRDRVKLVAPNYVGALGERGVISLSTAGRSHEQAVAISSGAMLSVRAFQLVGPFRSDFFIDYVDEEYCLRLRQHGFRVVCATRVLMRHGLGRMRMHRLLGVRVLTSHHPPLRRYYMIRNRVLTLRAFARAEPRWALSRVLVTAQELAFVLLLEEDKREKARAMLLGLWDGVLGRNGKATRTFSS
jgi:rhamnosyltransferase